MSGCELGLDDVLWVLKNPIRRKILSKISREFHYPLQLSKELNISQQSIMKHLRVLEQKGILRSEMRGSPHGPPRKIYYPNVHLSLDVYLSHDSYRIEFKDHTRVERSKLPEISDVGTRDAGEKVIKFAHELERCINTPSSRGRLKRLSALVKHIGVEIHKKEVQRDMLLKIRSAALRVSRQLIKEMSEDYTTREILHNFIEKDEFNIDDLSDELDIRIKVIEEVVKDVFGTRVKIEYDVEE